MARKFAVPIDLTKNELQNAVIQNLVGSPSNPVAGQVYYDSTANTLYYYNGSGWINAGGMTSGVLSARPAAGSGNVGTFYYATDNKLIYYSDGSVWAQTQQFGSVANLGSSAANGTSTDYARADHVHRHANADHSGVNLSALDVPLADISLNNHKITNLALPSADSDAANKGYVDNAVAGLAWKQSINLLATTNVPLTGTSGTLVIDGHAVLDDTDSGYRLLLIGQTTAADNGIYVYTDNATTYTLTRATDADVYTELIGASVFISEGTAYGKTSWVQANHYLTSFSGQDWVQFSGSGTYIAGDGLSLNGNIFNVGTASTSRIVVNPDNIDLATVSVSSQTASPKSAFINEISVDSYGRVTSFATAAHIVASTTTAGIASFSGSNFAVSTSGNVTASPISVSGTNITVSTSSIDLGGSLNLSIPQSIATTSSVQFAGLGIGGGAPNSGITVSTGKTTLSAGATSYASLNLPTGSQPSSPIQGDIWAFNNDLLYRASAATRTVMFTDSSVNMTQASGTLAVANGGTGKNSATYGAVIIGGNSTALSETGVGSTGQVLISNGGATKPDFSALNLGLGGTSVTGTLGLANGGVGATTASGARATIEATGKKTGTLNFTATTVVTVNHGFGQWVTAQAFDGSGYLIEMDVQNTATSSGTTIFSVAATSASATNWTYVIVG